MVLKVFFDGACEPINPGGNMGIGVVIYQGEQRLISLNAMSSPQDGPGGTSNNVAEYAALLMALTWLEQEKLNDEQIECFGDSRLVIEQCFGTWKIKAGAYVPIAMRTKELLKKFSKVKGRWIPREQNSEADQLSKARLVDAGIEIRQ